MSTRYKSSATCPDCGLEVAATSDGKLRPHGAKAVEAGLLNSPCAFDTKAAQRAEAARHRKESAQGRRSYWAVREGEGTSLPKHLQ